MALKRLPLLFFVLFTVAAQAGVIPPRSPQAMSGTDFIATISGQKRSTIEEAIYREISRGNIPSHLRNLVKIPVDMQHRGQKLVAYIYVSTNYLAIGSDADHIPIPMNFKTAIRLSQEFDFVLPTKKIVNAIAARAFLVAGYPLRSDDFMTHPQSYLDHFKLVVADLKSAPYGRLVGGFKKNLVLTNRLLSGYSTPRLALFGWAGSYGSWIQPLSTVHGARYVDYSHGIRMVSLKMWFQGQWVSLIEMAKHPVYHQLISDEGPIDIKRIMNNATYGRSQI